MATRKDASAGGLVMSRLLALNRRPTKHKMGDTPCRSCGWVTGAGKGWCPACTSPFAEPGCLRIVARLGDRASGMLMSDVEHGPDGKVVRNGANGDHEKI